MRTDAESPAEPQRRRFGSLTRLLRRNERGGEGDGRTCVLLAEPALIDGVRPTLAQGGVNVVAVAVDMPSLLQAMDHFGADLVVVDVPATPTLMIEAVATTRRRFADAEIHVVMRDRSGLLDELAESA